MEKPDLTLSATDRRPTSTKRMDECTNELVKNVRISTVASFPYFNRTGSVYKLILQCRPTFVSVDRRNNKARAGPTLHCELRASLFRLFTGTEVNGSAVPLKCGKLATKYPWIYGYFLQCSVQVLSSLKSNAVMLQLD